MSNNDLQASLKAISTSKRGAHPEPDRLLAYHLGELDTEDTEAVQEHVAMCSDCSRHVLDMSSFLGGEQIGDAELVSEVEVARLKRSVRAELVTEQVARRPIYATLGFARAAAAVFLLTSAALAGHLALSRGTEVAVGSMIANLPILELSSDETRLPGQSDVTRLPSGAPGAVLVFPLADAQPFIQYKVTIETIGGGVVFSRADLRRTAGGLLTLTVRRDALAAGKYRLRIYGLDVSHEARPLASFLLNW